MILYPPVEPFLQPKDTGLLFSDSFDNVQSGGDAKFQGMAFDWDLAAQEGLRTDLNSLAETSWGNDNKIFAKNVLFQDGIIEFDCRFHYVASSYIRVYWRWLDVSKYGASTGYRVLFQPSGTAVYVARYTSGTGTNIANKSWPYYTNQACRMRLEIIGSTFTCYHNDKLMFAVVDSTHKVGQVGIGLYASRAYNFRAVRL